MIIERFYLACLSHASYVISSNGEAAVIDPQRDVEIYLEYIERQGLKLRYVIETHLHADFVSGHLELAGRTGATVVIGHRADAGFDHRAARDGDVLTLGDTELRVIETPGHTPEGITIAATDPTMPDEPIALFTGDTLFAGDVGRPDLLDSVGIATSDLAAMLYDSLHQKIMTYPDETRIYPAHGAGSSCGKALRNVEFSTVGAERLGNYALQPMTRDEFVRIVTEGQPEAPGYFLNDARINRSGAPALDAIVARTRGLTPAELKTEVGWGAILLDTRDAEDFAAGHIPGSMNIGLGGQFATWVGTLLPIHEPLVIVAASGTEIEAVTRCARVGYDNIIGYLDGGFGAWHAEGRTEASYERMSPEAVRDAMAGEHAPIFIDVRKPDERAARHIPGAEFVTLSRLEDYVSSIRADGRPVIVHCAGGYRSAMAASILQRAGIEHVADLRGGLAAWEKAGLPVEHVAQIATGDATSEPVPA